MNSRFKISLQVPNHEKKGRFFSFRLKSHMDENPSEYKEVTRLFVVSDIEGNFSPFFKLLVAANVIKPNLEWSFGNGHLVVLGDCFDRGDEVTECLWLIYGLEDQARRAGGKVHFILGNHEIMNMNGDWRYVHPKYAMQASTEKHRPTALYYGNKELWSWLKTKNIVEKIGAFLFVHAGISPEILALKLTIDEINELARPWYGKADEAMVKSPVLHTLFDGNTSPFWYRGYYVAEVPKDLIAATLKFYRVNAIITGHTMIDAIRGFYSNHVINVNTDHANGSSEGLYILKKRLYKLNLSGNFEKIC